MPEIHDEERAARNKAIVAALRETFTPLTERLTPDIPPATSYQPAEVESTDKA